MRITHRAEVTAETILAYSRPESSTKIADALTGALNLGADSQIIAAAPTSTTSGEVATADACSLRPPQSAPTNPRPFISYWH